MSENLTNLVMYMICNDAEPLSMVEHEGFSALMNKIVPLYKIPSNQTCKSADYYCITCDNWTDCSNKSCMGIIIHYRNKSNSQMESDCLGCVPPYERHTSEYLKQSLLDILKDFNVI